MVLLGVKKPPGIAARRRKAGSDPAQGSELAERPLGAREVIAA